MVMKAGEKSSHMMTNDTSNYEFGKYLEDLLLLDLYVGVKGLSVNYDAKHLAKRLRTTLISEKCIGQRAISHVDLPEMMQLYSPPNKQNKQMFHAPLNCYLG